MRVLNFHDLAASEASTLLELNPSHLIKIKGSVMKPQLDGLYVK